MHSRLPWAVGQGLVAILMMTTVFYTVTSFWFWLVANAAAGTAGVVAAALFARPGLAMPWSTSAAGIFCGFNLLFGLANVAAGAIDPVPVALVAISVAQALLAWDAVAHRRAAVPAA